MEEATLLQRPRVMKSLGPQQVAALLSLNHGCLASILFCRVNVY